MEFPEFQTSTGGNSSDRDTSPDGVSPLEHEYANKPQRIPSEAAAYELTCIALHNVVDDPENSVAEPEKNTWTYSDEMEQASAQVPSKKRKRIKLKKGIKIPVYGEFTWKQIWQMTKVWLADPINVAVVFWMLLSAVAFAILGLFELGLMNSVVEDKEVREEWIETSTQILNALFVLMTVIFHPMFIRHTFQLFRWSHADIQQLRQYYNRGGHRKPKEWLHIFNLIILLHLTCLSMYAFAIIYWVYPRATRPTSAVIITLVLSTVFPILAIIYFICSPLQKDYQEIDVTGTTEGMEELKPKSTQFLERNMVFALDGVAVENPEWQGGLITGCLDKKKTALLTCLFPCLLFGINSQRLGFGHKFIQASVFILMIFGPMLVFELTAHTVHDEETRRLVSILGVVLAWTGLAYGAVWRIHMRQVYGLRSSRTCCCSSNCTDCCIWLFCPFCAICQEVRTAQHYQIVEKSEDGELYASPEDLEAGGADLTGTDLDVDGQMDTTMQPPVVMHEPVKGGSGRHGFVRLDKV